MLVTRVEPSHEQAANVFSSRRYVPVPVETPYPPGLAHSPEPIAAASRDACIVHAEVAGLGLLSREIALTPAQSTDEQWRNLYSAYHRRQAEKRLRVAFCRFEMVGSREALAIKFEDAPMLSSKDWEGKTLGLAGRIIQNETGERLATRIAEHGSQIS